MGMRRYRYEARDGRGVLARGAVEAESRPAALARLRRDGLVPVSVGEDTAGVGVGAPQWRRLALLALPVAAAAALWFWLARGPQPAAGQDGGTATLPPVEARQPRTPRPAALVADAGLDADAAPEEGGDPLPAAVAPPASNPAAGGTPPVSAGRLPEGEAGPALEEAARKEPLFRREAEQMLALYVQPGMVVPPTPFSAGFEADALAALAEDIVVTGEDTPEEAQRKELVAWMKEDMRQHLAGGGTVAGFFALMEKRQEEESGLLQEARRLMHELAREGDREAALAAHGALNEVLAEKGIAPLPLPRQLRVTE